MRNSCTWKKIVSGLICGILGMAISMMITCTLVEISVSPFFALYFGILFIIVGVVILYRISQRGNEEEGENIGGVFNQSKLLNIFGCMIVCSGMVCFVLEKDWCVNVRAHVKIPLYSLLSISISFCLVFSIVDLVNYISVRCGPPYQKPLVITTPQIYIWILASIIMGGIFGLIFGIFEIENATFYNMSFAIKKDELITSPAGFIIGSFAGVCSETLRTNSSTTLRAKFDEDYDEEI